MLRMLQYAVGIALFDQLAMLQHHDPVGDFGHHTKIMGDEHDGHVPAFLQVTHQFQDLRLGGDIECRGRLVGHQNGRLECQRHGNHGALALAARQLVGIGANDALWIGQADLAGQFQRTLAALGRC
jgi:hypothetical protein